MEFDVGAKHVDDGPDSVSTNLEIKVKFKKRAPLPPLAILAKAEKYKLANTLRKEIF